MLISCVDRPWPRWILNMIAYAHLIPVIDGDILARVTPDGRPLHIDWRIHTVGPGRACLLCLSALLRSDAALDRDGLLDDPDYLCGLTAEDYDVTTAATSSPSACPWRRMRCYISLEMIAASQRVAGIGPQHYAAFPGEMTVTPTTPCEPDCEITALTATAVPLLTGQTC